MNKQQAQKIIRETFESPFNKSSFTGFIKNLLNMIDDAPFTYRGNYIPDAYQKYIKTLKRIGKFSDGENNIDILVITLQKETSLERARTMQRNFISWYLNGSRGGEMKDAALAAFVSPGKEDWRFSLVKMEYKFDKNGKVKEEFSPARRWSFLVGANEKSHTAQSRLWHILADDENNPTLKQLEESFNIETVTKEFFLKYRELFLRTKEELDRVVNKDPKVEADFEAKGVDTVNFAKKLLGQIIFLYFLQKKGWFGVGRDDDWGTGSKHFLRELFEKKHGDYKNFFNDILEPLFYEALRTGEDRKHEDYYYSRFDCKIPFLNGGLFDPIGNYDWVHTDIIIPDQLFSNTRKTKEGDTGDGILDIFDRYNFTVKEDEPLEKEVAIDPELLGKAYEKFNAIRPDNFDEFRKALKSGKTGEENKFNKKFGVYYTPREIVHYMCRQSLINYLDAELNKGVTAYQKIGDSQTDSFGNEAIVGQLDLAEEHKVNPQIVKEDIEALVHTGEQVSENEVAALIKEQYIKEGKQKTSGYELQLPESIRNNAALIDQKLAEITVCDPAVGSGAFPVGMMSEIVRARNVLTPFLSLRGAQATCLRADTHRQAKQSQFDDNRAAYNFKRRCIEHSLYGVDIDPGAVEIAKLRLWLSLVVDEDDIKNIKPLPNLDYKIVRGNSLIGFPENWNSEISKEIEELKHKFFNETNPSKKTELKKHIDDKLNYRYENSLKTFGYKIDFDFKMVFSEVFHQKGGFDVVIANPPYVRPHKISPEMKRILWQYYRPVFEAKSDLYACFIRKSIELLRVRGAMSFIVSKTWLSLESFEELRKYILRNTNVKLLSIPPKKTFESATVETIVVLFERQPTEDERQKNETEVTKFDGKQFLFERTIPQKLFEDTHLHTFDLSLNDFTLVLNQKMQKGTKPLKECIRFFYGLKTGDDSKFIHTDKLTSKHKKMLRRSDFSKYVTHWNGEFVWYVPSKMRQHRSTARPGDPERFESPKILVQDIGKSIVATLDEKKYYVKDALLLLTRPMGPALKYILGILNSRLICYYYSKTFTNLSVAKNAILTLPIRIYNASESRDEDQVEHISKLVDRILTITRSEDYHQDPQKITKVKALEAEIDQLVYKLYELTPEEIRIVEGD